MAESIFAKYPDENHILVKYGVDASHETYEALSNETVSGYQNNYDKKPLIIGLDNEPIKGFIINNTGYSKIVSNKSLKGLFLRFAKRNDNTFTLILEGLDKNGNLMKNENDASLVNLNGDISAYDNTPACPPICPPN